MPEPTPAIKSTAAETEPRSDSTEPQPAAIKTQPAAIQTQPAAIYTQPAADGYPIAARSWRHASAGLSPRGQVIFLHGIISHSGWYTQSCDKLAQHGFDVTFLDRRGSGMNTAGRGDVDTHHTWLRDVEDFLAGLPTTTPRILIGISWGGKLAAEITKRRPDLVDGLGLICPGIYAFQFPPAWKYRLLAAATRLGLGGLRVPIPLRDPALFTDVPRWQHYIATDASTLRRVSLRFALADRALTESARQNVDRIRLPTWMVLAGRDRIVDNTAMRRFFDSVGSPDKELTEYPEAAHTFEFEPDPTAYWGDLIRWVESVRRPPRNDPSSDRS